MNKAIGKIIKITSVISLAALMLSACGKKDENTNVSESVSAEIASISEEKNENIADSIATIDLNTAVDDMYSFTGQLGPEDIELVDVEYHVPKITLDLPGAKSINKQIEEDYKEIIETPDEIDYYPTWYEVSWSATLNNEVLSLTVTRKTTMDEWSETKAYNLNVETGEQLDNIALLKLVDVSEEDYLAKLRKAAAYEVDQQIYDFFESGYISNDVEDLEAKQRMFGEYLGLRRDTISTKNIRLDLPLYLNENGELLTVTEIGVMAGGGIYQKPLCLSKESNAKDINLTYMDAMFVDYSDGCMTIRVEKNDWSARMFGETDIEYGKNYPVHGVCKDYIEGCMVVGENEDFGYPTFLSDDGLLAMIQPYECADGLYFCMNEPVFNIADVKYLADNPKVHDAVRANNLLLYPEFVQNLIGLYCGDGTSYEKQQNSYVSNYYLGFNMEDAWEFMYQDSVFEKEIYRLYSGTCRYIGMDENGAIFDFYLENIEDSNDKKQGLFTAERYNDWKPETNEWLDWIEYSTMGGSILFDEESGPIILELSQG